jgi:hypothetical protein
MVDPVVGQFLIKHAGKVNDGGESRETTAGTHVVEIREGALVVQPTEWKSRPAAPMIRQL